jgi:hypothetical protein
VAGLRHASPSLEGGPGIADSAAEDIGGEVAGAATASTSPFARGEVKARVGRKAVEVTAAEGVAGADRVDRGHRYGDRTECVARGHDPDACPERVADVLAAQARRSGTLLTSSATRCSKRDSKRA